MASTAPTPEESVILEYFVSLGATKADPLTIHAPRLHIFDNDAQRLAALQDLQHLNLAGTRISDLFMPTLAKLTELAFLDLGNNNISDHGAVVLSNLKDLETLSLKCTRVTDKLADTVMQMPCLMTLDVSGTQFGDDGLLALRARETTFDLINVSDTLVTKDCVIEYLEGYPLAAIEFDGKIHMKED